MKLGLTKQIILFFSEFLGYPLHYLRTTGICKIYQMWSPKLQKSTCFLSKNLVMFFEIETTFRKIYIFPSKVS